MKKHNCKSCGGPLTDFKEEDIIAEGFCPYCVNAEGKLNDFSDIMQNTIDYIESDLPDVKPEDRISEALKMLEEESEIWSQEFSGYIIEESLNDKSVLNETTIVSTEITKQDDNPSTNHGFKIWHINKITLPRTRLKKVIDILKNDLKDKHWFADLNFGDEVYIIFKDKAFSGDKKDKGFMNEVNEFAKLNGLFGDQLPFRNILK